MSGGIPTPPVRAYTCIPYEISPKEYEIASRRWEGNEWRYLARDAIGLALWLLGRPRFLLQRGREGGLREPEDVLGVHGYGDSRERQWSKLGLGF
jgi:hypothetical protein